MKKYLNIKIATIFILFFSVNLAYAQQQVPIYFDSLWNETSKDKMVYYRLLSQEGTITKIKDYYRSGKKRMEGAVYYIGLDS
ncbi:hypothetical protein HW49_03730 [Porphyromonadaceae bacterium COT-184 OH4590]|nr:hypothetical protein HW49_03730 [Porphyromonadaceae bacterium COT-184 OH4590]